MNLTRRDQLTLEGVPSTDSSLSSVGLIFESGLAMMAGSIIGNGANYLFMLFLARQLGMDDFGLYALGLTLFNTVVLLSTAGLDSGAVKLISERHAQGDHAGARRMVWAVLLAVIGAGLFACVCLVLVTGPLVTGVYGKPDLLPVLLWFAVAVPFAVLTALLFSLLQAHHTVRYTVLIKYVWEPLGKWALAGLALLAGWGLTGVVGGIVVSFLVSAAFAMTALVRVGKVSIRDAEAVRRSDFRILTGYCVPLVFSNIFGVVAPRTDVLVLGYWVPSHDVGVYLASFQTAAILALVLGAFDVAFAPIMSQAQALKDGRTLRECYVAVHRMTVIVAVPIFVLLLAFGNEILGWFGPGFSAGTSVLALLACGHLINCATGCSNTVLLMTGRSQLVLLNTILYGVALAAGTVWFIPLWGVLGAATVAALCFVGLNGLRVYLVWKLHRMVPWTWKTLKPLAAAVVMASFFWFLKPFVVAIFYIPLAVLGCGVYCLVLHFSQLETDDRRVLAATLAKLRFA